MAPFSSILASTALLLLGTNAHFTLTTPPTVGFVDDTEGTGPCGGVTPDFGKNTVTDFPVGGSPVGMRTGHPQTTWLFRGTLDQTGAGGWTRLFPIVQQNSIGAFCQPAITAPQGWVGKKGLVGVVAKGEDGLLYQCAAVNFVSGTGSTQGVNCQNASSEAVFTSDSELAALASSDGSSGSGSGSSTPNATTTNGGSTSTPTPTPTGNAAAGALPKDFVWLNGMATVLALGAMGVAYVL